MRYSAGRHANNWSFLEEVFKESIALQADTEDEAKKTIEVSKPQNLRRFSSSNYSQEDLTSLVMQDMNDNITISAIKEADNSASLVRCDLDRLFFHSSLLLSKNLKNKINNNNQPNPDRLPNLT